MRSDTLARRMNPAPSPPAGAPYTVVGRYAIFDEIASGGMATVHLGRLVGAAGFSRTVAIKRLHPQLARDRRRRRRARWSRR